MLDIRDKKIVSITPEGIFQIDKDSAHSFLMTDLHNLLSDTTDENFAENYKYAKRLVEIAPYFFDVSEETTNDSLVPLMMEIVKDEANRKIAALVAKYCIAEFWYKIREKKEVDSTRNFYLIMRDPVFTLMLRPKMKDTELYHRIAVNFFDVTGLYDKFCSTYRAHNFEKDYEHIKKMDEAIEKSIEKGKPYKERRWKYQEFNRELIAIPLIISWEGLKIAKEYGNVPDSDIQMYQDTEYVDKTLSKNPENPKKLWKELEEGSYLCKGYNKARDMEFYAANYYMSQILKSDASRREVAQWLDYEVYSYHYFLRSLLKKTLIAAVVIFVGYQAWKLFKILGVGGVSLIAVLLFLGIGFDKQDKHDREKGWYEHTDELYRNRKKVSAEDGLYNVLAAGNNGKELTESGWYMYNSYYKNRR